MRPLNSTEIRRASLLKHGAHDDQVRTIITWDSERVCFAEFDGTTSSDQVRWLTYEDLADDYIISYNGGVSWEPCRKET